MFSLTSNFFAPTLLTANLIVNILLYYLPPHHTIGHYFKLSPTTLSIRHFHRLAHYPPQVISLAQWLHPHSSLVPFLLTKNPPPMLKLHITSRLYMYNCIYAVFFGRPCRVGHLTIIMMMLFSDCFCSSNSMYI